MLTPADRVHVITADGFADLGLHLDADAELERVSPGCRHAPEVLKVRLSIYRALGKWQLLQTVARRLTHCEPHNVEWHIAFADSTRHVDSLTNAMAILLGAVEHIPDSAELHYRLSCYECQLGEVEVAKARLAYVFKLDPALRARALDDEDLKPVWDSCT